MSTTTLQQDTKLLVPKLRFKEFSGKWEMKTLADIAEFSKGKGISKADITPTGKLECIRYGELYTTYNELIVNIISKTDLPIENLELSRYNDVIIPASGESQIDIATASCILKDGVALSGDLNIIRSSLNGIFLSYYLNNNKKIEIAKLAQGSSVVHLYSSQLKKLNLNIPTLPEQQKIASFLSAVDEKIQQLQQKVRLLEQYKKGVMQQLFSGKLRFKDENGNDYPDWEEKKLGDVGEFSAGGDLDKLDYSKIKNSEFTYPIYANGAGEGIYGYATTFQYEKDCVTVSGRGNLGLANHRSKRFNAIVRLIVITPFNFMCPKYLEESINQIKFNIESTGVPQLTVPQIKKYKILIPHKKEQQKIADFLSGIDSKQTSTNQQLNHLQQFKKGLLQQLFV